MTPASRRLVTALEKARSAYDPDGEMDTFTRLAIKAKREAYASALLIVLEHLDSIEYESAHGPDSADDPSIPFAEVPMATVPA
jgi:hypothetical protein